MKGKIAEVFASIQGEGLYLGEHQLFVRFFGCNLGCKFCDTKLDHFKEYEPLQLLEEIKLYRNIFHSISFTGGEPLLQKDFLKEILPFTSKQGYKNYLETNGTLHNELSELIGDVDIIAMDVKLPSSTGLQAFWDEHRQFLKIANAKEVFLKAVVCQSSTEEDLRKTLDLIREINRALVLVLQPDSSQDNSQLREKLSKFKEICLKENILSCIIPQVHKSLRLK